MRLRINGNITVIAMCGVTKSPVAGTTAALGRVKNNDNAGYDWCKSGSTWDCCPVKTFPYPTRTVDGKIAVQTNRVDTMETIMHGTTLITAITGGIVVQHSVTRTEKARLVDNWGEFIILP
jgi:hypothetical protein